MKRISFLVASGVLLLTACGGGSDVADVPATVSVADEPATDSESTNDVGTEPVATSEEVVASADGAEPEGFLFTSPLGDYTVTYLAEPVSQDLPIPLGDQTVTAQAYVHSTPSGSAYFSSAFDYPPELAEPDVLVALEGARDGAIASSGATLVSSELVKRNGYRGLAFTFSVDDGVLKGGGSAVVFYENPRLFQAFAVGPIEELGSYQAFVDSFEFTQALEDGS